MQRRRQYLGFFLLISIIAGGSVTSISTATATTSPSCGEPTSSGGTYVVTCEYTGGEQSFTVPAGVTSLHVVAVGGRGGAFGAHGAVTTATLQVLPGSRLYVEVGGNGGTGATPGFNGGGEGGSGSYSRGGGGGGASDVRTCTVAPGKEDSCEPGVLATSADPRLVVAAGGGGGTQGGGDGTGGTPIGRDGSGSGAFGGGGGKGGTLVGGGAGGAGAPPDPNRGGPGTPGGPGVAGSGGNGGSGVFHGGGGGGGGYFGGGGGGGGSASLGPGQSAGAGGGGSSYAAPGATGVSFAGDTTGEPSVTLSYAASPPVTSTTSTTTTTVPPPRGVVAGSTWYSDGTKSKAGGPGTVIAAYAVGALQNVPYRLVLGTGDPTHACTTVVQVLNQTIVYAGPSGLIGRVSGTLQPGLEAGTYKLCFEDASAANVTGTGGATFTVQ